VTAFTSVVRRHPSDGHDAFSPGSTTQLLAAFILDGVGLAVGHEFLVTTVSSALRYAHQH